MNNKPRCPHCNASSGNLETTTEHTMETGRTAIVRCRLCGKRIYPEFIADMHRSVDYSRVNNSSCANFPRYQKKTCTLEGCDQTFTDTPKATSRLCTEHSRMFTGWKLRSHLPCPFIKTETGYNWNPQYMRRKSA